METTTVPLTIAPEAAAHVAALGLQREFEQMLDHARKNVPGLRSIAVWLAPPYDTGDEDCVRIDVMMDDAQLSCNAAEDEWGTWKIRTFSPDVHRHFVLLAYSGPES